MMRLNGDDTIPMQSIEGPNEKVEISADLNMSTWEVLVEMSKKRQTPEHLSKARGVKSWTEKVKHCQRHNGPKD